VKVVPMVEPPKWEYRPIESLMVYARNSRTHSPDQVRQIVDSMDEFGFTNAILADAQGIVAGHGRVAAAIQIYANGGRLRWMNGASIPEGMVPVMPCDGWTENQRRAYIIADNKLALNAGWDEELLRLEIGDLRDAGFEVELLGFSDDELADLFGDAELAANDKDPDDAPALAPDAITVPGDTWVLGAHRLRCGSSLEIGDWDKLMNGELADVVWTDPPYNVDIGAKNKMLDKADKGNRGKTGAIMNDKMGDGDFYQFLLDMYAAVFTVMKSGAPIYVAHADMEGTNFRKAFQDAGFKLQNCLIWNKNNFVLGRHDYQPKHEPILYGWKPGSAHRWYGGRKQTTVVEHGEGGPVTKLADGRWAIKIGDDVLVVDGEAKLEQSPGSVIYEPKPQKSDLHPTMKPVALVERMLKSSARGGDIVVDAFGGSGTTLVAADRLGMSARLMELDPHFCDVIIRRWQNYTGRRAVHAETGEQFPDAPAS